MTVSLSDLTRIRKNAVDLRVSPEFNSYSRVVIHVGQDDVGEEVYFSAGDDTGRTLEIENPWGTQAMAEDILADLRRRNFQYQPYTATTALVDPSAELGDGVELNDLTSGIYKQSVTFGSLMASDISAPQDEEVDHEFPFQTETQRLYKRETTRTRSLISINKDSIQAEVSRASEAEGVLSNTITLTAEALNAEISRATSEEGNLRTRIEANAEGISAEVRRASEAEGTLSSRISANATEISAKVSQIGGNNASGSFSWSLTADGHYWYANGSSTPVMSITRSGLSVRGAITALSGYIGNGSAGFAITNSAIYNGMKTIDATTNGIYLGTNGIALGGGKFKVTNAGALTAGNATLTGGYIGNGTKGFKITASAIMNGMTGYSDTTNDGVYIGTNGIALGGGKFKVSKNGALYATSGKFEGSVYASNIKFGDKEGGYFDGAGISGGSVQTKQLGNNSVTKAKLAKSIKEWLEDEDIDVQATKDFVKSVTDGTGELNLGSLKFDRHYVEWRSTTDASGRTIYYLGR